MKYKIWVEQEYGDEFEVEADDWAEAKEKFVQQWEKKEIKFDLKKAELLTTHMGGDNENGEFDAFYGEGT